MTAARPTAARGWRSRAGVRVTTSLTAAVVVGLALAASGALLMVLLERELTSGAVDAAQMRAMEVAAAYVNDDRERDDGDEDDDGTVVSAQAAGSAFQVLDGDRVVASSPGLSAVPLTALRPGPGLVVMADGSFPGPLEDGAAAQSDDGVLVVRGVRTETGRDLVVVVVQSLGPVRESTRALGTLLVVGAPALTLAVAAVTYVVAGRALRPVEAIRRRVEGIGPAQLQRRVPVPPAHDEVGRLAVTMNAMLDRLEASATAQQRFVSDASHELRSPLATVRTSLEVAQAHPARADWPRLTAVLLEETARVQALVSDLLVLARADESGLALQRIDVDLDDLCGKEAERLRRAGVDVVTDVRPARVLGDPARLARVLRNLGDNAARHCAQQVALRLSTSGDLVVLEVSDDGPGVPADERERVFERFVRLDQSRARQAGGTGLGLPIVRQLVQAHGGSVVVTADRPGATFRVVLPALPPP